MGGKTERTKELRTPRVKWESNNNMDFQEVVCGRMDWIDLAWDRDRWRVIVTQEINIRFP